MNVQFRIERFLSDKVVFRIVCLFLTGVLALSAFMSGTLAWSSYVSRVNTFFEGAPGADRGLMIRKNVYNAEDPQPTEEELDRLVFSFLVEIPSVTESAEYILYDKTGQVLSTGSVAPTGDIDDPNSIIQLKGGQYAIIPNLPVGTWYRISEIPILGFETDSIGSSGHIIRTEIGSTIADFKNTYYANGNGVLELRKTLNIDSLAQFEFDVRFEANGYIYDGPIQAAFDGGEPQNFENPGVVTLSSGGYARFIDLQPGLKYIITERDYSGDNYYPAAGSFTGFICAGEPVLIDADNYFIDALSREKGSISLTKRVTGNSADTDKGFRFVVSFEDAGNVLSGTISGSGMQAVNDSFDGESGARSSESENPDAEPGSETPDAGSETVSDLFETDNLSNGPEESPESNENNENNEEITTSSSSLDVEEITASPYSSLDVKEITASASSLDVEEITASSYSSLDVEEITASPYSSLDVEEMAALSSAALDVSEFYPEFQSDGGAVKSSVERIEGNACYITLFPGETAVFANIPEGIKYTAVELTAENPSGYTSANESISGRVIGLVNQPVLFVNHKSESATLRVSKQTSGMPDEDIDKIFTIWVYINRVRQEFPVQLKAGETSADIKIPIGAHYEVVEENYADDGYLTYVEHATGVALVNADITTLITNYYNNISPPISASTPTPPATDGPAPMNTPTPVATSSPEFTNTPTPVATSSPEFTNTPTPVATSGPEFTNTPTPVTTSGPGSANTPTPTAASGPESASTPTPMNTPTPAATSSPESTNTPTLTATSSPGSTNTPAATSGPALTNTPKPVAPTRPPYETEAPYFTRTTRPTQRPVNPPYYTNSPAPSVEPPYYTNSPAPSAVPTQILIYTPMPIPGDSYEVTNTPALIDIIPPDIPGGQGGGSPQTGDASNPAPWFAVMILSALLLRYVLTNKSRLLGR
ncbi:MAG: hypothetical protein LBB94_01855 [Clostridiales bacterium]|jgi:hypothetical protein|nr:hypothetical protein [Clostridiales bacterium]